MTKNPAVPLQALISGPNAGSEDHWLDQARAACAESLERIEAMRDTVAADRDTLACLGAVSKSLQWVLSSDSSASQLTFTVRRAIQVFDRISARS